MRSLAYGLLAAAGLTLSFSGSALAADTEIRTQRCAPGQVWNGYQCAWQQQRRSYAPQQQYVEREEYDYVEPVEVAPVYVAPRVYVAPPVYVARPFYAPRYYARPHVRYYAPPRYYGWRDRPWRHYARR